MRHVEFQAGIHHQLDGHAIARDGGQIAHRRKARLRLHQHGALFFEGIDDFGRGAQMHLADLAVHRDGVTGAGIVGNALQRGDHGKPHRAGNDGDMARGSGFFQHQRHQLVAAIIQEFGGAHAARDQHRILRQGPVGDILARQVSQQPPRQIVKIVRALTQDGIAHALHPQTRFVLHAFHGGFGGQSGAYRIAHALAPALVIGEQAIGLDHLAPLARQVEFAGR